MPQYPAGLSAEEYDELKTIVERLAQDGSFDANDLLAAFMSDRLRREGGTVEGYNAAPVNAGSVAQILDDLVDLGVVRRVPQREGSPAPRYELA